MTKQEQIEQLKQDLHKARTYGDRIKANELILSIEEVEKLSEAEWKTFNKVKKLYGSHSVTSGIIQVGKLK